MKNMRMWRRRMKRREAEQVARVERLRVAGEVHGMRYGDAELDDDAPFDLGALSTEYPLDDGWRSDDAPGAA